MKLRIKSNSIRLRLSKSEVLKLENTGYVEEQTLFGDNTFKYGLEKTALPDLSAKFDNGKIIIGIPTAMVNGWPVNEIVGFNSKIKLTETDTLSVLVEKDFICINETSEDQSDNYENPNNTC